MYNICLVEDEKDLNNLIKNYLQHEGYNVISKFNGTDAIETVSKEHIDLWILDIMLGDNISGYDIIKKIRETNVDVPVIFTSARDQDLDKIIGLELGSDDYVTKPYSPKELVLRVHKLLDRVYKKASILLNYETYNIDLEKRTVHEFESEIKLTTLEFDLLIMLVNNKTKSYSREDILLKIWGNDYYGSDRVVDDLVRRLRKKMPKLRVNTLYGFGYRLT
ncbi:MAG: response regulator transcription factor [Bacilli bacterium]